MIVAETFAPSLLYLAAGVILIAGVRWTRQRRARWPYTPPLWVRAYGILLITAALIAYATLGTGKHRKPHRAGGTG